VTGELYDQEVVTSADRAIARAIGRALGSGGAEAVVGVAPAGAGKSYAIGTAVLQALDRGMRVMVACPTNEQAHALVFDLAARARRHTVTFIPASNRQLPVHTLGNVVQEKAKDALARTIRVGTLDKLGDAAARGDLPGADLLLIDEAYQANAVHYYRVADLAPRHLLMGDSGQLSPFSTAPDADRWRGLGVDPLLRAVDVLMRNHPGSHIERLPITRRLDARAAAVAQAFYPDHRFHAAVLPQVRRLTLSPGRQRRDPVVDAALDHASTAGWAHVELPASAVLIDDPEIARVLTALAVRLLTRDPMVRCERSRTPRRLVASDVAVLVSHNDQKDRLRALLAERNLTDVAVMTANKAQGLTFEVVLAWHPLAGLREADEFHLDPGRMCVMLTRHRQACVVVGRAGDRALVEGIPPATPAYTGWDLNPALEGWYIHEGVFEALAPHRLSASSR